MAAFGVCLATATAFIVKEEVSSHDTAPQPTEYVVKSFRYDAAKDIGKIMASETFSTPVSRAEAASAMVTTLRSSSYEFANYFPDVPEPMRDGDIACHVTDSSKQNRHFELVCTATPNSGQTGA